jgi:hypothetical protein
MKKTALDILRWILFIILPIPLTPVFGFLIQRLLVGVFGFYAILEPSVWNMARAVYEPFLITLLSYLFLARNKKILCIVQPILYFVFILLFQGEAATVLTFFIFTAVAVLLAVLFCRNQRKADRAKAKKPV